MPAVKARPPRVRKIDPFVAYLEKRFEQGVLNAEKLYQEIRVRGYTGKGRTVRQFVQPRRAPRQPMATVRLTDAGYPKLLCRAAAGGKAPPGTEFSIFGRAMRRVAVTAADGVKACPGNLGH